MANTISWDKEELCPRIIRTAFTPSKEELNYQAHMANCDLDRIYSSPWHERLKWVFTGVKIDKKSTAIKQLLIG